MRRWLAIAILLFGGAARAHEFWILPDRFVAEVSQPIGFALRVGSGWPGDPFPRDPSRIVRFALVDADGERPLDGQPGADPAGRATPTKAGTAIAIYRSNNALVSLEAAPFESYLRDEGLERVIALRAQRGTSAAPSRERYSRNAKALVSVGAGRTGFDRVTGLTLELIPRTDPRALKPGGKLVVDLRFRGQPIEGVLVKALAQRGGHAPISARTDADGQATLVLPATGVWLINAVHMLEAPAATGIDWESWWTSLTFEVR